MQDTINDGIARETELKKLVIESDKKYMLTVTRLAAAEEFKEKLAES